MSATTDAKAELHREIGALRPRSAGLCALRLSLGRARHAAGGRRRSGGLAVRRAAAAGAGAGRAWPRPCGSRSPRATASASRRWSRGSSCGRSRPCTTRAAWSAPTPRRSCAPRPGPSSPSGTALPSIATGSPTPRRRCTRCCPARIAPGASTAITWSENNTEAIAGLHNKGRRAFALLDEASAIPDAVWETIEGALTDAGTELFWCVFGNPTRNTGRFRECFAGGRFAHRWRHRQIDSRSVGMTNKAQIAAVGEGLRRGVRLHPRARARRLPARRLHAVHRQRARAVSDRPRAGAGSARRRW